MFKNKKGLTLIELLAVIAIIAILFVLLIPQVNNAIEKARETGLMTDLRSYQIAGQAYFMEHQSEAKTVEEYNKYLDKELQFIDGKSKELNPWGEPYEIELTTDGLKVNVKKDEDDNTNNEVEYGLELSEVNGEFVSETIGLNENKNGGSTEEPESNNGDANNDGWGDETYLPIGVESNVNPILFSTSENTDGTITIIGYFGEVSDLIIPAFIGGKKVTEIANYAFHPISMSQQNGKNTGAILTSVVIPSSVTKIYNFAFQQNNLTSVTIPNSVKTIGLNAFYGNKIEALVLPDSVTSIGINSFYGNKIKTLTLSKGLRTIDDSAFYDNEIESLEIHSNIKTIGNLAFAKNNISELTFAEGILTLGWNSFETNNLTTLTIPSSMTFIDENSFTSNPNLQTIKNCSNITTTNWYEGTPNITTQGC